MARVVMADDGVEFDGSTPNHKPMGGAEAAFLALAEALAARGHEVIVRNNCAGPLTLNGVQWAPISRSVPESCALYIGNRGHRLIGLVPNAGGRVFWLHNPGAYLLKPRYLWPLLVHRPAMVFSGAYHASTVPWWVPDSGRSNIPYGLEPVYRTAPVRADTPPPVAIFTSNPLRGLDWLLEVWVRRIHPAVPKAELHLYCGPAVYGAAGDSKAELMGTILGRADGLGEAGVHRHPPLPRSALVGPLRAARLMLYRGDEGETFCLALAEAQALGLPAVVQRFGCVSERIKDGITGAIAGSEDKFVAATVALLTDDGLWHRQHQAAIACQKGLSWSEVAARFETFIP